MNQEDAFNPVPKRSSETSQSRRSGQDRRREPPPITPEQRLNPERRELLNNVDAIIAHYREIPFFQDLSREQMIQVLRICSKKKIPGEQKIQRAGQESKDIFIVLKGSIRVLSQSGDIWMKVVPFGTIGELGFFMKEILSGDVITDTECIILRVSGLELARLLEADQSLNVKLLQNILRSMAEKLRNDHDELMKLSYRLQSLDRI